MSTPKTTLYSEIENTISGLDISTLSKERKKILQPLIDYIAGKIKDNLQVRLNFICTHNSRRSHISQVWAQAMAIYYNVPGVSCYSGGTEATALFPAAASTLADSGFRVEKLSETDNPVYSIKSGPDEHPVIGFSKTYDHSFNPQSNFAAIMTCSQADAGCPFIPGAEKRIPINYEDPKIFDGTAQQDDKYRERSLQIATELSYIFSNIKSHQDAG